MTQTEPSKEPDNFHAYKTNTAKAERNRRRQILRDRIDRAASGIVDVAERIIDELRAQPPAAPTPPLAVARRQLANTLHLAHFCDNKTCRRARCCRGEPLHCLRIALPLMPAEALAALVPKSPARRNKRGRAHRP